MPLNTMGNRNHHKTIRSTHGKFYKDLVPWLDKQRFSDKLFHDSRNNAPPRSMYRNNLMEALVNEHKKIELVPG